MRLYGYAAQNGRNRKVESVSRKTEQFSPLTRMLVLQQGRPVSKIEHSYRQGKNKLCKTTCRKQWKLSEKLGTFQKQLRLQTSGKLFKGLLKSVFEKETKKVTNLLQKHIALLKNGCYTICIPRFKNCEWRNWKIIKKMKKTTCQSE